MVTIRINKKKYNVCTKWEDVADLEELVKCKTLFEEIKALTNIPLDILSLMSEEQIDAIGTLVSFLDDINDLERFVEPEEVVDVGQESYEKLEFSRMQFSGKLYQQFYNIAKIYYPDETNVRRLISKGYALHLSIVAFLENYVSMLTSKPSAQEEQAGIEELSMFGSFGTAFNLAGKDLLKMKDVYKLSALEVYTALHFNFVEHKYVERLYEIKFPNQTTNK